MKVHKVETTLAVSYLKLVRNVLKSNSRARSFYIYLLNMHICDKLSSQNNIKSRASRACDKYDISFSKYMFGDIYAKSSQRKIKIFRTNDGLIDSVRQLWLHNYPYDKAVLNMLLPF